MKKSMIIIFLVAVLIFSSIVMISGKKEDNRSNNGNIEMEENEDMDMSKSQDSEEENMSLEEPKLDEESLMRIDSQNGIDMAVIFNNLLEDDKEYIVFKVMVNNHRIDLEDIKYAELSKLRLSDGTVISEGFQWKLEGGSGHHILGYLKLPKTYNGNDLINDKIDSIQLEVEGVGDAGKLNFKWDKDIIDYYNGGI